MIKLLMEMSIGWKKAASWNMTRRMCQIVKLFGVALKIYIMLSGWVVEEIGVEWAFWKKGICGPHGEDMWEKLPPKSATNSY